jgi:hypothetical protein
VEPRTQTLHNTMLEMVPGKRNHLLGCGIVPLGRNYRARAVVETPRRYPVWIAISNVAL